MRILLLDNDECLREALAEGLRRDGHTNVIAAEGMEAVATWLAGYSDLMAIAEA